LLDPHQDWSPAQIKSGLVNRADVVVTDAKTGIHDIGPTAQGAGRENLSVAANGATWLSPVSASFGKVPASSPRSVVLTVFNPTGNTQTFTVSEWKFTVNRSEEHTSELQSPYDLVCRLLLEKKKKKKNKNKKIKKKKTEKKETKCRKDRARKGRNVNA